jgi:phosphoribosylformylglycinamidine synthase PurS subunit
MTRVTVLVRPKDGILDPQGDAIARSLAGLGFPVESVRAGKVFDVELAVADRSEAERVAREAAEQALANGLIEGFEVVLP